MIYRPPYPDSRRTYRKWHEHIFIYRHISSWLSWCDEGHITNSCKILRKFTDKNPLCMWVCVCVLVCVHAYDPR